MFEKGLYYRINTLGKRCEILKEVNPFFRNYQGRIEEMKKADLSEEEQLKVAMEWLGDCSRLELVAENTEWYLVQEGYHYAGELFERTSKKEERLYCAVKEFECGVGLLPYFQESKNAKDIFVSQVRLGRRLAKSYKETEDWNKAFYYINTTMDYMLSAKGLVLDELIDELLVLVLEDRQEISEKIKK